MAYFIPKEVIPQILLDMPDEKLGELIADTMYDGDSGTIHAVFCAMIKKFPDTLWLLECFSYAIDDAIRESAIAKKQFEDYRLRINQLYNHLLEQGDQLRMGINE